MLGIYLKPIAPEKECGLCKTTKPLTVFISTKGGFWFARCHCFLFFALNFLRMFPSGYVLASKRVFGNSSALHRMLQNVRGDEYQLDSEDLAGKLSSSELLYQI